MQNSSSEKKKSHDNKYVTAIKYSQILGQALGNVVAMPITGLICATKYGWPLVFYVFGGCGIIWCILWVIFAADTPTKHKTISKAEKLWLENKNFDQESESVCQVLTL